MMRARPHLALSDLGETEVEHLREISEGTRLHEEDVLGLQIAVDDPGAMGLVEHAPDA